MSVINGSENAHCVKAYKNSQPSLLKDGCTTKMYNFNRQTCFCCSRHPNRVQLCNFLSLQTIRARFQFLYLILNETFLLPVATVILIILIIFPDTVKNIQSKYIDILYVTIAKLHIDFLRIHST